jgi:hypothetical protein
MVAEEVFFKRSTTYSATPLHFLKNPSLTQQILQMTQVLAIVFRFPRRTVGFSTKNGE